MALCGIAGSVIKDSLLQVNVLLCNNMRLIVGFHSNGVFFQMNPKDFENSSVDSPKKNNVYIHKMVPSFLVSNKNGKQNHVY